MNKRKQVMCSGLLTAMLVLALVPLSLLLETARQEEQTAEAVYEPLLNIHNQIAAEKAQECVPVGAWIELEEAWAIEDTREESLQPLITSMLNGDSVLGFDSAENTFYCTLGMETGMDWPEMNLMARNAPQGLRISPVDDYTYDWCEDAIREGYRYEMLAYTDTQYSYFGVVFTGLPIVSVCVEDISVLGETYIPARVAISSAGHEAVDHTAMIHLRGGGYTKPIDKASYRIEFHEIDSRGKDRKKAVSALGIQEDTDWLLLSNASDSTCVRNMLCWDLWHKWNPEGNVHGLLESRLVEVFVNQEYMGLYQLMQRYDIEKELAQMGENPESDYVYRVIGIHNPGSSRPIADYLDRASQRIELRHMPQHVSQKRAFEIADDYIRMNEPISDEEFIRLAQAYIDIEAMISYYLFHQAADLSTDNVQNNLYIWATRGEDGGFTLKLSPWDMDLAFTTRDWEEAQNEQAYLNMPIPRRILDMNLGGSREILWRIWNEKRSTILTDDAIYTWFTDMEDYVNRSGASLRDSQRWYGEAQPLNLALMMNNETMHMTVMEKHLLGLWPLEGMVQ